MPDRRILIRLAAPLVAMAFCVWFYSFSLRAWFQEDDFAWLGLRLGVHSPGDLLHALFAPMAQGTIRPISERAFFMLFSWCFGLNAVPYRLAVLGTQLCSVALLCSIARRLTGSQWAAVAAPILWIVNIGLAKPMTWTSAYNEVLCAFSMLLSFWLLLRYIEKGDSRFNRWQWVSFLVGFGILEINVMYPALAILYTALFARRFLTAACWMVVPSLAFAGIHGAVRVGPQRTAIYDLHFDAASSLETFAQYWRLALGGGSILALTAVVVVFVAFQAKRGNRLPLFCCGWFVLVLAPFLPVRDHVTDYYLAVPSIGLALLGASAVAAALGSSSLYLKAGVTVAFGLYVLNSAPLTRHAHQRIYAASQPVKRLVRGVEGASKRNPGQLLLLDGVDDATFWNGVYGHPFRLLGIDNVFLTPHTVDRIHPYPELGNVADYILPEAETAAALAQNRARVLAVEDGNTRDVTSLYMAMITGQTAPKRLLVAHPVMATLLGPTWYPPEGDMRWMPQSATVHLGGADQGERALLIEAACAKAPVIVRLTVNGVNLPQAVMDDCQGLKALRFELPLVPLHTGLEVTITVDRTVRVPPDQRDLGLAVRSIALVP